MQTIGFDLDGVLYNWRRAVWDTLLLEFHEKRTFFDFWNEEEHGVSHYNKMFWYNLIRREDLYENMLPAKNVVRTLKILSKRFEIKYITHRSEWVRYVTEKWLKNYSFPSIENLIMSEKPKHILVRQHDCAYYVEDRSKILDSELKNVCTLFGMRTVDNGHLEGDPKIQFIDTIPELLNYIRR